MDIKQFFDESYNFVLLNHTGYTLADISTCPNITPLETIPKEVVVEHALGLYGELEDKYKNAIIRTAKHVNFMGEVPCDDDRNKTHTLVKTDIEANSDYVLDVIDLVSCLLAESFCKAVGWEDSLIKYHHKDGIYDYPNFPFSPKEYDSEEK